MDDGMLTAELVDLGESSYTGPGLWSQYMEDGSNLNEDDNAMRLMKLGSLGMYAIKSPEGDEVAYLLRLGSDGGRPGYVIVSTNDVVKREK